MRLGVLYTAGTRTDQCTFFDPYPIPQLMNNTIVLATLNARYIHSAFGLRYLKANLHELETHTTIQEFTLDQRPLDIAEKILKLRPVIIGLGVYIWNVEQSHQLAALIKKIAPDVHLVLGGPEVSYEQDKQPICQIADHTLSGPAEGSFYALCKTLLDPQPQPATVTSTPIPPVLTLDELSMPYYLYSDEDLAHRILYVEASRGCPFKCEFCLSALDKTAKPFALARFLDEMESLYRRGARHFKFVDRTFNLSTRVSIPIMQFFLDKIAESESTQDIFVHFEVIPDRLPDALKQTIAKFPPGCLQFEVGVQTFNPEVQAIVQRKQDNLKTEHNLRWLCRHSPAHIHADLIFGLPGESLQSMAQSFNKLADIGPHEIQLGILKRLRGMPMAQKEQQYEMVFNPNPPYDILSNRDVDFPTMQKLRRLARYWDLVANSGRFKQSLALILADSPFERFMRLSEWLHQTTGQTHKISLKRLFDLLYEALIREFGMDKQTAKQALQHDYDNSGIKGLPQCLLIERSARNERHTRNQQNKRQRVHIG